MYSNIRLLDCINRPKDLIDKAIELGLSGIAITDHECLSGHMEVNQYAKKIKETHPDFRIVLGNEIYLVDKRENGIKYYHFILTAKDAIGHKALREMSSIAWYNSYTDRGMERVPITKEEMANIMSKYKGHVVASTACMGGELSTLAYNWAMAEKVHDTENANNYYRQVCHFLDYCLNVFGEDFYIECAPSTAEDQCITNRKLYEIACIYYNIPMIVGTDSHYLTKEDRFVHKSYLNSKGGEREVDSFYEFAHLMSYDEVFWLLKKCFDSEVIAEQILNESHRLREKFTDYSLERKQMIPKVKLPSYSEWDIYEYIKHIDWDFSAGKWPVLKELYDNGNIQERYWLYECAKSLMEKGLHKKIEYWDRLEIEADVIKDIGEKLDDCLYAYFNTFKHYIDLFWECGSIVGPGRGSATGFLSNYLLGITQLDPIRWGLKHWRFLNKERPTLPDIDIDLAPSKRPAIFKAIRQERGELGLVQVATFGTEGTKSAILTACRGYRSEDYPDGIDVDVAQYMSSLIPQERGFLWSINDVVHGNEEKGRKPVSAFVREVQLYPGLLDIIKSIDGLVNKRSSHASGVILYGNDPYETASFMRTPSGDLITCYDLGDAESAGDTKYDFLVTEISDKIIKCFELLVDEKVVESCSLRNLYNKYIHPEVIDTSDKRIWEHLASGDVLDVFQFNTGVGLAIAKRLKPKNPMEMTAANAMMRLMSDKDKESQQDRYVRIQTNGLQTFDIEMRRAGLSEEMIEKMHYHCDQYWGCCAIQEQMMELLMDVAGFTLGEADFARKVVAKKQMAKIPELRKMVYERFDRFQSADYFWENVIAPQLGYAFSLNHSLPYSFVGIQSIYFVINFNPIYWNTACLIVNSGSLENLGSEESEDEKTRKASTDYGKIAKAIGDIQSAGIKISLANINKSSFGFAPDVENNRILFGLKGMLNVGDELVDTIIKNRPYASPKDFLQKVKPNKQAMISLIKGGAFDEMEDRKFVMAWYIWESCDKKSRVTLQNLGGLIKHNLLPEKTEEQVMARRVYEFNRYLKAITKADKHAYPNMYSLDERASSFLREIHADDIMETDNVAWFVKVKNWDSIYQKYMDIFRQWIADDRQTILDALNTEIFLEDWNKYARGTISAWEMEVLCFYYHEHELANLNNNRYGFVNFFDLPEEPEVEKTFKKSGKEIPIFKLHRICGTCIAKDKTKSTVSILTCDGVVTVKFRKEYFSLFDKQISERQPDGTKKIVEKSWFNRGNMIVVTGMRSGDNFVSKKYASTGGHQLYKIEQILPDGNLILQDNRHQGDIEE
jgi:DNA polymerase-3 subunit alpha